MVDRDTQISTAQDLMPGRPLKSRAGEGFSALPMFAFASPYAETRWKKMKEGVNRILQMFASGLWSSGLGLWACQRSSLIPRPKNQKNQGQMSVAEPSVGVRGLQDIVVAEGRRFALLTTTVEQLVYRGYDSDDRPSTPPSRK